MNNPEKKNKMATESVAKLVVTMSLPPIVSMFIQSMYNVVDSIFVSRISVDALTSVSLAFPLQMIIVSLFVGTGAGISSLISRRLGEGNNDAASKAANHGLVINIFYSLIMAIIGIFFVKNFVSIFTDDPALQNLTTQYLQIILIVSFGSFITQAGISILQATGNTFIPMVTQLVGAITNIILDPIFIFGWFGIPAMGVRGAAIATVVGQLASFLLTMKVLYKDDNCLNLTMKDLTLNYKTIIDIYDVGLPAIIMQALASVMVSGLNIILISFSSAAVAVLGIYFKLQSFIFMPIFGLAQGFRPIIGYNFGAQKKDRVLEAFKTAIIISVGIMLIGTLIFQVFPKELLSLFDSNEEMMLIGVKALKTISLTFAVAAVGITISTTFQAFGKGMLSLIISFTRQIILLLPAAYILSKIYGLSAIWYSFIISEIISVAMAVPVLYIYLDGIFKSWDD
nr:MATE family efflux transporter [Sedimentibacter sp.]